MFGSREVESPGLGVESGSRFDWLFRLTTVLNRGVTQMSESVFSEPMLIPQAPGELTSGDLVLLVVEGQPRPGDQRH